MVIYKFNNDKIDKGSFREFNLSTANEPHIAIKENFSNFPNDCKMFGTITWTSINDIKPFYIGYKHNSERASWIVIGAGWVPMKVNKSGSLWLLEIFKYTEEYVK